MRWLQPKGAVLTTMGVVGYAANKRFARGMFGVAVHGLDHLPQHGPFVLAPNHNSNIDPYVLAAALPYAVLRQTYWAGSIDMFYSNAAMRLFSRVGQVLPVAGAGTIDVRSSLAFALAALQREHNLIWFPEGRLSPNGELLPFRQGLGIVLHHSPVPVVPVYIQGTHQAMPRGQFIPRPHPVTVTIGQPHDPQELNRRGEGDYPHARIVHALHTEMRGLITV
jgi:long-chain acyl-CoA synthetase